MAEDTEVLRQIWDGHVPISFTLAADEVCLGEQPEPVFLFVRRMTYFPLVVDRVHKYLGKYADQPNIMEMWLEDENGVPIQWHYPVGVLYDLAMPSSDTSPGCPWPITIHFRNFPERELIRFMNRDVVESAFMSAVKEADCLKHRGQIINAMQKKEHKQLFQSLVNDKFDAFWAINRKLMEHVSGEAGFRNIPFRIHRQDQPFLQLPFQPFSASDGQALTLGELIRHVLPDVDPTAKQWHFIIHGIEVPIESPVQYLSEHLSYADNFLHICLVSVS